MGGGSEDQQKGCPIFMQTAAGIKMLAQVPNAEVVINLPGLIRFILAHFKVILFFMSPYHYLYSDVVSILYSSIYQFIHLYIIYKDLALFKSFLESLLGGVILEEQLEVFKVYSIVFLM